MKKRSPPARIFKPPPTLSSLVSRPGGLLREEAIARGKKRMEAQREPAQHAMLNLIAALESSTQPRVTVEQLRDCLGLTDQLISLALMFGNEQLAQVAERFCALMLAFIETGEVHQEPIAVHIQALRMFAPPANPPLPVAVNIQTGLDKILIRFGVRPFSSGIAALK